MCTWAYMRIIPSLILAQSQVVALTCDWPATEPHSIRSPDQSSGYICEIYLHITGQDGSMRVTLWQANHRSGATTCDCARMRLGTPLTTSKTKKEKALCVLVHCVPM